MKRKAALAAIVITISFSIGYLTYFGTNLFVDFLRDQVGACGGQSQPCSQEQPRPLTY